MPVWQPANARPAAEGEHRTRQAEFRSDDAWRGEQRQATFGRGLRRTLTRKELPVTGWLVAAVLLAMLVLVSSRYLGERARRKQAPLVGKWPIDTIRLAEVDPAFVAGPFGPSLATEVAFVGRGPIVVPGGTSDAEAWVLSVLAKTAQHMFEFGTCTGKTAYLWARNAPAGAQVVTLTLAPEQQLAYVKSHDDSEEDTSFALKESNFTEFLYSGTAVAGAIEQLYGDSKHFDESPWESWADLVFVDGSHARSYVASDSAKAMRIVKPSGMVLWHDYAGPKHAAGVFDTLNEMSQQFKLERIEGTTLVMWRRPS